MIRIKTIPLALITVVAILGGISIAKAIGYYETQSTKQPVKFKTGELAGMPNPADIRGSYTWQDIEKAFDIPADQAAEAFSTQEHILDPASRVSLLEEIYKGNLPEGFEIGTGAVRVFVSLYTGLPLEFEEGTVLPNTVLALLKSRPNANLELLKSLVIPGSTETTPETKTGAGMGTGAGIGIGAQSGSNSGIVLGKMVVGKTTFADLYDWGLSEDQLIAVIGYKPSQKTQTIRDSAIANGREFSEFRSAIQTLLDTMEP